MKFYQQVRYVKRSKFAKLRDDSIISWRHKLSEMTSKFDDVKIWWLHISVKNAGIALKLCRLFELVVAIICASFASFYEIDRDLQKYRYLLTLYTYDVIGLSLSPTGGGFRKIPTIFDRFRPILLTMPTNADQSPIIPTFSDHLFEIR